MMKEIRFHGRGGQGVVIAAEILVTAFVEEGKYAAGFPFFGAERRGAPVMAFVRVDEKPIREKTQVYSPDCVVVVDPKQIYSPGILIGLKKGGILVVNSPGHVTIEGKEDIDLIGSVDATKISLEEIEIPAPNTCMLGSFAATTGWLKLDSIRSAIKEFFSGKRLEGNLLCAERGYEGTQIYHLKPNSSVAV